MGAGAIVGGEPDDEHSHLSQKRSSALKQLGTGHYQQGGSSGSDKPDTAKPSSAAQLSLRSGLGEALQAAAQRGQVLVVEALLSAKADANNGRSLSLQLRRSPNEAFWGFQWDRHYLEQQRRILEAVLPDSPVGRWNQDEASRESEILKEGHELVQVNGQSGWEGCSCLSSLHEARLLFRQAGGAPVHAAVAGGQARILEVLLAARADPDLVDEHGRTAWQLAERCSDGSQLLEILKKASTFTAEALHRASAAGDVAEVGSLLDAKAYVNLADGSGACPLHLAAEKGHEAVAEALVAAKADANLADGSGTCPLHLAADNGHKAVAEVLLAAKADANAGLSRSQSLSVELGRAWQEASWGNTPLHLAALAGHVDLADCLLRAKADPRVKNNAGQSPLEIFATEGRIVLELKMQAGIAGSMLVDAADSWEQVQRRIQLHFAAAPAGKSRVGILMAGQELDYSGLVRDHLAQQTDRSLSVTMVSRRELVNALKEGNLEHASDLVQRPGQLTCIV